MALNPQKIKGNWDEGFVLDKHTVKATYIGESVYGIADYKMERTKLGELVFELKNRLKIENASKIVKLISPFLDKWEIKDKIDVVLPVPPSNKNRLYQPAAEIAEEIAKYLKKSFYSEVLEKTSHIQSKNMAKADKKLKNTIKLNKKAKCKFSALLVDDLYDTGKTLNECISVLKKDPLLKNIYVLAMTKTKG